ncbi:hypothetical protein GIB67_019156 [Kingdonia uniflora]|uniref:Uncharacterized protein n=1 Tax=Kingdonia uniflora TaxID=39325 RepID=A0A7J7MZW9_9MAGN|nr:hypothetical protein GIB67_019156 [Kingdonia uniflora]
MWVGCYDGWSLFICVRIVCHPLRQVVILCVRWPCGGCFVLILRICLQCGFFYSFNLTGSDT